MSSGLFIDITTLRPNRTAEAIGIYGMMMCKDRHWFWEKSIYPLRDSFFKNVHEKVTHSYTALLEEEYKPISLTRTRFEGHTFNQERMEWIPDPIMKSSMNGRPGTHHNNLAAPKIVNTRPGSRRPGESLN